MRPTLALRRQINEAIDTVIARAGVDRQWVHWHFIHHNKASYLVIPNLYAADPKDEKEATRALAMNQLAGVLSDLELVRWPKRKELKELRKEETIASSTDLTEIRKKWFEEKGLDAAKAVRPHRDRPIRNHGLFSKAERALEIAGWSEAARDDIEIFRLVDTEGLTPLLMVLNESGSSGDREHAAGAQPGASAVAG